MLHPQSLPGKPLLVSQTLPFLVGAQHIWYIYDATYLLTTASSLPARRGGQLATHSGHSDLSSSGDDLLRVKAEIECQEIPS